VRELKKERGKRRAERKRLEAGERTPAGGEADSQLQRRARKRMRICFGRNTNTANIIAGSEGAVARSMAAIAVDFASLAITREETEFSTSNYDNKSHAGTELTTVSSDADDVSTPIVSPVIRPYSGDSVKSIFLRKYTFGTQKLMKNKSLLDEIPVEFLT